MPTVGRILATERIRQGLDLNSVAEMTKITLRTLRAIEADDFEQLPGAMLARNFVRQYAQALKLDAAALADQFNREQSIAEPDISGLARGPEIHVPGMSRSIWSRVLDANTVSAFFTLVLTLAVCGGAFYGFEYLRARNAMKAAAPAPAAVPSPPRQQVASPTPAPVVAEPAASVTEPPTDAQPTESVEAAPVAPAEGSTVHVAVEATEACWARVTVDGKTLFTGTLSPGDPKTFDGAENVSIRAGNAGALAIKLNGNDVPAIGPKGQIRIVTLTASGAQVRTPTPDPVLDF